ncbi:MAG: MOP flippase family protein [Epsilonproteobacteria bacterium]|nr:MOP flippase family protein [Campylobacterota bacterium]
MSLKSKFISSAKWATLGNIFRQIMQVVSIVILARILTPDDYGVYAILMIFIGFLNMFVGMGTSAAIIHIDKPSENLLSTIFFFNIGTSILFYFILFILAPYISIFFENPEIETMLRFAALTFIIASLSSVHATLFSKSLNFKTTTIIGNISILGSFIIGVAFAMKGYGVYSLVIRALADGLIGMILTWFFSNWKPKLFFSFQELKKIFHFTSNLTGFTLINYFARNADNFLIGKFLGSTSLGIYNIAYTIMLYPLQNISHTIIRVLFPALSEIKHDNQRVKNVYLKVIFFIALITFPLMSGLMATSDLLVAVIFGDKWQNLGSLLLILAPIGMMQSIVTTVGSLFMTKGNVNSMFKIGTINAIVTVASFIIGIQFGVEGVAISYLGANLLMLYPNLLIAWRQIDLSVKEGLLKLLPIFIISIFMAIGVFFIEIVLEQYITYELIRLILLIFSGAIIYLALLKIVYKDLNILVNEFRNK